MVQKPSNIFDETTILTFSWPEDAKRDAVQFGRDVAASFPCALNEVQVNAFPPDGVKLTMSHGDRCLVAYFFGDGRFVFGQRLLESETRLAQGELSLGDTGKAERERLYSWLAGGVTES